MKQLLFVLVLMQIHHAMANDMVEQEKTNRFKAAMLLNIAAYAYWPDNYSFKSDNLINLCLYQENTLENALKKMAIKKIHQRKPDLKVIKSTDELQQCQILFVPYNRLSQFTQQNIQIPGLLTLTDNTGQKKLLPEHQSIIVTLIRKETRISFSISQKALTKSQLKMSSELLKLGDIVN